MIEINEYGRRIDPKKRFIIRELGKSLAKVKSLG